MKACLDHAAKFQVRQLSANFGGRLIFFAIAERQVRRTGCTSLAAHRLPTLTSAVYYFNNLEKLISPSFSPSDEDILRARVRTTGIIEARFQVKNRIYKVLDVGGQRSERRKWIACFESKIICPPVQGILVAVGPTSGKLIGILRE